MNSLLEQIRALNEILKKTALDRVSYSELATNLCDILQVNTYISGVDGEIIAYKTSARYHCELNDAALSGKYFPEYFNKEMMSHTNTVDNIFTEHPKCTYNEEIWCVYEKQYLTVIPIQASGQRLGNLLLAKYGDPFDESEIVICEYASAIVAMEMLRSTQEAYRQSVKQMTAVKMAYTSLSFSEQEAVKHIFEGMECEEKLVVASSIAEESNITRSVISNALRKFESAGVIHTRSLGMKGTYIKITNPMLLDELNKLTK
jgi:transcriptional pleiotropic repressor